MLVRRCSDPLCRRTITACFGTTKAGDILELFDGTRALKDVRELCPECATKAVLLLSGKPDTERLAYFKTIGWG